MEQALEYEFDRLEAALKLWDKNPDVFIEMLGILDSLKDPFHAIDLLREGQVLSPAELFILANVCACVKRIRSLQEKTAVSGWPGKAVPPGLDPVDALLAPGSQGQPRFYISDAYSPALAETRKTCKQKQEMWQREMSRQARAVEKALGLRIPGTGEIAVRKSDHDRVEKSRSMPELGETRQTLAHVYFRLIPNRNAVNLEKELSLLKSKQREQERQVLRELSRELKQYLAVIEAASHALGELDFLLAKVESARSMDATRPEIIYPSGADDRGSGNEMSSGTTGEPGHSSGYRTGPGLVLQDAFHPMVRDQVEARGGTYQPITIELDSTVSVITGPNMGGKTVALATAGLCVAMAQWGLMVPCRSMKFSLYDLIYFQPGVEQTPGLSSFAAEIVSLKQPLARAAQKGLVLLDEVGRGTNPSQGRALYAALLQYYLENDTAGSTVVATTHYHGLAAALGVPHWQVKGLATESLDLEPRREATPAEGDGLDWLYRYMDYTLQKVGPDTPTPQDALVVAKALGLEETIVDKALKFHGHGG